jgi:small nuclear ribonucleoprotein (snRNP)-like protein
VGGTFFLRGNNVPRSGTTTSRLRDENAPKAQEQPEGRLRFAFSFLPRYRVGGTFFLRGNNVPRSGTTTSRLRDENAPKAQEQPEGR